MMASSVVEVKECMLSGMSMNEARLIVKRLGMK